MTDEQSRRERLRIALSEVEEALDYYAYDEAFVLFAKFEADLKQTLDPSKKE